MHNEESFDNQIEELKAQIAKLEKEKRVSQSQTLENSPVIRANNRTFSNKKDTLATIKEERREKGRRFFRGIGSKLKNVAYISAGAVIGGLEKSKDTLTKAKNAAINKATRTKEAVIDSTIKAKDSVVNTANKTKEAVIDGAHKTKEAVVDGAVKTKDFTVEKSKQTGEFVKGSAQSIANNKAVEVASGVSNVAISGVRKGTSSLLGPMRKFHEATKLKMERLGMGTKELIDAAKNKANDFSQSVSSSYNKGAEVVRENRIEGKIRRENAFKNNHDLKL